MTESSNLSTELDEFLILIHGNVRTWDERTPQDLEELGSNHGNFIGQLISQNHFVRTAALADGLTLRQSKTDITSTGAEIVGGFYIVKAASLEEAAEMARQILDFDGVAMEIRPILRPSS
ncbi:hypothetical cytosolic protein [Renibacterium salmoninarum ATCC 33209]|uniref:Hypothetical cytosolic protein n=1 Tax=Renibacterium salmoninarum (strain ATCC 33209 / DSM 20767 / JCM 11484 / NBRC 15589 / NCIMB 2235) TaxID=288705 RepID=A9WS53_RENSM|nr:YciI family protein [Renibacterium salmoninarum]ABY24182.1 hypothetical cytosolic protein [Renibacterium salmoninarum ATCC 33209]